MLVFGVRLLAFFPLAVCSVSLGLVLQPSAPESGFAVVSAKNAKHHQTLLPSTEISGRSTQSDVATE